uniref:RRM domain-containing protein n=1 Tax=Anopheles culicifacies TaxID=139723 RepID=A0A182MH60_9DIPT
MAEVTEKEGGVTAKPAAAATKTPGVEGEKVKKRRRSRGGKKTKDAGEPREPKKPGKTIGTKGSGLIFIKHLPKGFGEEEMREFFSQFGDLERVCVARSKKSQQSRGYGYVHFRFYEVAEIAASAINNYMMFGRVLKATVLPKQMIKLPRNFGKAYDSKGEQTGAYRKWLQKRVRTANSYLGDQVVCERFSKQLKRLKRAEKELSETGIELPEVQKYVSTLKSKTGDLKKRISENLAKKAESDKAMETDAEERKDTNDDDEDEEDAFSPLQSSDWKKVKSTANETAETTEAAKKEAVKVAEEKKKEFALATKRANTNPITDNNKENKKATPAKKQPNRTAKQPIAVTNSNEESSVKASPVKKEAKKANVSLSKKKQEATAVTSPKIKGKPAAKSAKSAKLGKKVK